MSCVCTYRKSYQEILSSEDDFDTKEADNLATENPTTDQEERYVGDTSAGVIVNTLMY